ncbi:MAG TPA: chromate efflux transporter [Candidatus Limnocylindria bacterium]
MPPRVSLGDLARYFLRLGALGFGGPIALAATMQRDLVEARGWISQDEYLEGLAASQTLPGPLAAQLAMWLGYVRRGTAGALVSAIAFVAPPFVLVTIVAAAYVAFSGSGAVQALFYGIGPAVIALIVRGAWKLVRVTVRSDRRLLVIFAAVAVITFALRAEIALLFVLAGVVGIALYAPRAARSPRAPAIVATLAALPVPAIATSTLVALGLFFFEAGAFTFGSGLAIVPFLQSGVVRDHQWLTERQFLDAVAIGMITPGPVVITAVFVGFLVAGLTGALVAGTAIFFPPLLMVVVLAPWITRYRRHPAVQGFTRGATAAAAGAIVGAAAIIATQVLVDVPTVAIAIVAFVVLWRTKVPEPAVVAVAAVVGLAVGALRGV